MCVCLFLYGMYIYICTYSVINIYIYIHISIALNMTPNIGCYRKTESLALCVRKPNTPNSGDSVFCLKHTYSRTAYHV